jgi:hypothetical protein
VVDVIAGGIFAFVSLVFSDAILRRMARPRSVLAVGTVVATEAGIQCNQLGSSRERKV